MKNSYSSFICLVLLFIANNKANSRSRTQAINSSLKSNCKIYNRSRSDHNPCQNISYPIRDFLNICRAYKPKNTICMLTHFSCFPLNFAHLNTFLPSVCFDGNLLLNKKKIKIKSK